MDGIVPIVWALLLAVSTAGFIFLLVIAYRAFRKQDAGPVSFWLGLFFTILTSVGTLVAIAFKGTGIQETWVYMLPLPIACVWATYHCARKAFAW